MIYLQEQKEYFIIVDNEVGWNKDLIFEGKQEVFNTFREYADIDEMEDITLKGYTFADCMDIWNMEIRKWEDNEFRPLNIGELNYKQD